MTMRFRTLLTRTLLHHWRANLAVLMGVVVGTAVLTGSLLVGDSLRGSLRDLTLNRLGGIDYAVISDRFFPADLAERLPYDGRKTPALLLRGAVLVRDADGKVLRRAGQVQVVGVDESFWPLFGQRREDLGGGVILNEPLAHELRVTIGDQVEVRLDKPQAIPADSLLGRPSGSEEAVVEPSPVAAILPSDGPGRFSLNAQQHRPLILYVSLRRLQTRLQESVGHRNAANLLLVQSTPAGSSPEQEAERLQSALTGVLRLEDVGLSLRPDQTGARYLSLESRRLLLEPAVVQAAQDLAKQLDAEAVPTLTYLANLIADSRDHVADLATDLGASLGQPTPIRLAQLCRSATATSPPRSGRYVPYSPITALDPSAAPPWGPFIRHDGSRWDRPLAEDEILLNEWAAKALWPDGNWEQLRGRPVVAIRYFVESDGWLLKEETRLLKLAGVVKLEGAAADRTLTPDFPGLRNARRVQDWDPPFPPEQWHREWIRKRDEDYWDVHRATPKAFVSPATAQKLWKSRFGEWTSVRLAPRSQAPPGNALAARLRLASERQAEPGEQPVPRRSLGTRIDSLAAAFRERFWQVLPPAKLGVQFRAVKAEGLKAAAGSTAQSFGWLFLGFSFFLIGSAAMLVGLLFRLGVERRAKELGLLTAAGYPRRTIRRLLLTEGAILAVLGGLAGIALAVGYARLLVSGLAEWWSETLQTSFLRFHIAAREESLGLLPYPSLTLGLLLSVAVALAAILWAVRGLGRLSPRGLLAGQAALEDEVGPAPRHRWSRWAVMLGLPLAAGLAIASFFVPQPVAAPLFFGSGFLILIGGLSLLAIRVRRPAGHELSGTGLPALLRLGARNPRRHPARSLLTAGLLASATFLVVAVESFRKSPGAESERRDSGTGGFALLAEADVPLYQAPDSPAALKALLPDLTEKERDELHGRLAGITWYGFRVRPGDDVSCLNLYQPQQPRILGVPEELIDRGGFAFGGLLNPTEAEERNPWLALHRDIGPEVPVLVDDHTAQWILHKSVGDTLAITDERGQEVILKIVGLLKGSIFQSELLISLDQFRRLFPSRAGYGFFLIESTGPGTKETLEATFGERYGLTVSRTTDRLAAFHAVENTYLSTFQLLGGLGVLLGTLGLAVVLLRNIWERQGELALLRAVGYRRSALGWLVLAENGVLVLLGLGLGIIAALVAVTPHLLDRAASLPWLGIAGLVGLVLAFGFLAGLVGVVSTLRTPLLPALRRE